MMGGVNFQPGTQDDQQRYGNGSRPPGSSQGIQEAIKVLSLRLPKVVGANAVAPNALLSSQGGGGNPHIDSLVDSVLAKYFPQASQGRAVAPMIPAGGMQREQPQQGYGQPMPPQQRPMMPAAAPSTAPRVIVSDPPPNTPPTTPFVGGAPRFPGQPRSGYDTDLSGGGQPPGMFGELPSPLPDLRRILDWVPEPAPPTQEPYLF